LAGWTLFKKKENPTHFIDIKTVITKENSCYYSPRYQRFPTNIPSKMVSSPRMIPTSGVLKVQRYLFGLFNSYHGGDSACSLSPGNEAMPLLIFCKSGFLSGYLSLI
jgi:hypothetical protein